MSQDSYHSLFSLGANNLSAVPCNSFITPRSSPSHYLWGAVLVVAIFMVIALLSTSGETTATTSCFTSTTTTSKTAS